MKPGQGLLRSCRLWKRSASRKLVRVFQAFANRWMVMEEKLDDGRWLDIGEILIRQPRHRTFKFLDLLRGLQGVLVSLVLYRPAIAVADWHDDQAKGPNQGQQQG